MDPFSVVLQILPLIGSLPSYLKDWDKIFDKLKKKKLKKDEIEELKKIIINHQKDYLFHKIILLNLVLAFSKEHNVNKQLVDYSNFELIRSKMEFNQLNFD